MNNKENNPPNPMLASNNNNSNNSRSSSQVQNNNSNNSQSNSTVLACNITSTTTSNSCKTTNNSSNSTESTKNENNNNTTTTTGSSSGKTQNSVDSSSTLAYSSTKNGRKKIKTYEIREKVGGGSFGTVKMVYCQKSQKKLAMKEISRYKLNKENLDYQIEEERQYLQQLAECPFVIDYVTSFEYNDLSMTVMEFGERGDIKTYNEKYGYMDFVLMKFFATEIISGLVYLQDRNIIHRDLKPENILIMDNWHIKLCDFMTAVTINDMNNNFVKSADLEKKIINTENNTGGSESPPVIAKVTSFPNSPKNSTTTQKAPQDRHKFVGTTIYMSPETAKGMTSHATIIRAAARKEGRLILEQNSPMIDNWALGCVIYFMLTGEPPFRQVNSSGFPQKNNDPVPNANYFKAYNKFPQLRYLDTYRYFHDHRNLNLSFIDYHRDYVIGYKCELPPSMNKDVQAVLNDLLNPEPEKRTNLKSLLNKNMFKDLESFDCHYIYKNFQCPKDHTGQFLADIPRNEYKKPGQTFETKWNFPEVIATKDQVNQDKIYQDKENLENQTTLSSQQSSDTGGGGTGGVLVHSGGNYNYNFGPGSFPKRGSYESKSNASSPPTGCNLPKSNSPPHFMHLQQNFMQQQQQQQQQNINILREESEIFIQSNDTPFSGSGLEYWSDEKYHSTYLHRQQNRQNWLESQTDLSVEQREKWKLVHNWNKVCGPDEIIIKMGMFRKRRAYYSIKTRMFLLTYSPSQTNGFTSKQVSKISNRPKNYKGFRFAYYDADKFREFGWDMEHHPKKQCYKGEIPLNESVKRHHIVALSNFRNLNIETPGRVYYLTNYKDAQAVNWQGLLHNVMEKLYGSDCFDDY